ASNESGIYFAVAAKPARRITINAYIDRSVFPWLRYRIDAPSHGSDFLVQVNFIPDKKTDMYFRFRHRDKFTNANDPDALLDYIVPLTQDNWRFHIQYPAGKHFRLRNRVEFSRYHPANEKVENGFVILQDITWKRFGFPLSVTGRYALFQTDSYSTAIYTYENDMPYSFSIPAYYYSGSRWYLLINWDITRKVEVYFRISRTIYSNQEIISPGTLNEITGNTKTEAKVMLRIKL
ncbi:MAG TPA: hypothetical protein VI731_02705, partial [Bacteroidia bacterium]|nr:hypothetical protein [Bacteroidia bacterium]